MFFFAPPPPPPASYSRQVAPIFAMHCNGCHGGDGGLSTRSHAELMRGGNLGKVVIPGDAENSLLIHFLEGRRGEAHRMPLGGRPLSPLQLATLRHWINEGALEDAPTPGALTATKPRPPGSELTPLPPTTPRILHLASVPLPANRKLRIYCRINTAAYLMLTVRDPRNHRTLFETVASIKSPRERVDSGEPGELIWWDILPGHDWPKSAGITLAILYPSAELRNVEFYTGQ